MNQSPVAKTLLSQLIVLQLSRVPKILLQKIFIILIFFILCHAPSYAQNLTLSNFNLNISIAEDHGLDQKSLVKLCEGLRNELKVKRGIHGFGLFVTVKCLFKKNAQQESDFNGLYQLTIAKENNSLQVRLQRRSAQSKGKITTLYQKEFPEEDGFDSCQLLKNIEFVQYLGQNILFHMPALAVVPPGDSEGLDFKKKPGTSNPPNILVGYLLRWDNRFDRFYVRETAKYEKKEQAKRWTRSAASTKDDSIVFLGLRPEDRSFIENSDSSLNKSFSDIRLEFLTQSQLATSSGVEVDVDPEISLAFSTPLLQGAGLLSRAKRYSLLVSGYFNRQYGGLTLGVDYWPRVSENFRGVATSFIGQKNQISYRSPHLLFLENFSVQGELGIMQLNYDFLVPIESQSGSVTNLGFNLAQKLTLNYAVYLGWILQKHKLGIWTRSNFVNALRSEDLKIHIMRLGFNYSYRDVWQWSIGSLDLGVTLDWDRTAFFGFNEVLGNIDILQRQVYFGIVGSLRFE